MQEKVNISFAYVYNIRMDVIFQKDSNSTVANKKPFKTKVIEFFKDFNNGFYFFLFLCLIGLLFFISSLWENQFTTLFGGDYTAQQLPFYTNGYDDWWHFFKTGEFRFFSTNPAGLLLRVLHDDQAHRAREDTSEGYPAS